ncbi:MAG: hypothetical protein EHM85_09490 [Desulfobacteraceae bacterium]|nr:MAG: hypothetical protein EHM85_09490 [Desulfobacteraceae bacterium]
MNIEVPETVRQQTNRCPYNFACLAAGIHGGKAKCKIDYINGRNVLILAVSEGLFSCPYRISFGDRQICFCPVHYYLYSAGFFKTI